MIVGWGVTNDGIDFFIAKNGWGEQWGEKGYMKIKRGKGVQKEGKCGLLMQPSLPIISREDV